MQWTVTKKRSEDKLGFFYIWKKKIKIMKFAVAHEKFYTCFVESHIS